MISLEQVKLLESRVAKTVDYVKRVTGENRRLETTLESYRKRIEELEVLIQQFKEDQGKIEDGILAALDRLNQFEDAVEKSLSAAPPGPEPGPEVSGIPAGKGEKGNPVPEPVHETPLTQSVSLPPAEETGEAEPEEDLDIEVEEGGDASDQDPGELDIF